MLGAGIQTQVTHYMSVFASYQYTYYGSKDLQEVESRRHDDEDPSRPRVEIDDRHSNIDTNIAKVGIVFNF